MTGGRLAAAVASVVLVAGLAWNAVEPGPAIFPAEMPPDQGLEWSTRAGVPDASAVRDAVARAGAIRRRTAERTPSLVATPWELAGPRNVGGRVVDLVVHPTMLNTVFVASAGGGVWKSTDAGITFVPAWSATRTQSMGALAISADGKVLYAGTGEANPGGGSLTYPGDGVYRSRNGGRTWAHAGLPNSARIGRLVVDPRDPERVLAAVAGDLFTPGGPRGIYVTNDGGTSWTRTLRGENGTTGGIDIVIDPSDPDRVYAALWDHRRLPEERRYEGPGTSIYRSLDGGLTWEHLTVGLPEGRFGRIGLTVAPLTGTVYADITGADGRLEGIFASEDGGETWNRRGSTGAGGSAYEWWFGRIWADPLQPLHLFRASLDLQESFNGGDTWVPHVSIVGAVAGDASTLHPDQHAMVWDPLVPNRVYLGNDGGVYRGHLVQTAASWIKGGEQPFTQFYSVDVAEDDPSRIVGGAQDNGAVRSFRSTGTSPEGWNRYNGGDGEAALISPRDHTLVYGCSQYGSCSRSTTSGDVMSSMGGNIGAANWFSPLEFDPSDPRIMYWGGTRIVRSSNAGRNWTVFSPELTQERGTGYPYGTITTIAAAKSDPEVVLAGTDDGLLWRRNADGWVQVNGLPAIWVSRVAIDPEDAAIAYVALSGYRAGDGGAFLYRTEDGGATWRAIGAGLPPAPVNDVVPSPHGLLVATDVGVFVSADPGAPEPVWDAVGDGLPLAPVTDIRYHAPSGAIFAATFGRGIWRLGADRG